MKRIIKTLILALLVLTTAMSTTIATVSAEKASADTSMLTSKNPGVHIFTAPEVDDERYILRDGEFLYTLVVPTYPTVREKVAADEFVLLLKRATGVVASMITDDNLTAYNPDTRYISIGQTKLLDLAGISIDRNSLKTNGVRIITKDNNIFLSGGVSDGALNAVYDFFQICFDFEWYSRNNIYINDTIKNLKLRNFDVIDIPDVNAHSITYGPMAKQIDTLTEWDKKALASPNLSADDLTKDINNKNNRSRYSKPGRGIIFTAHGTKVLGGKTSQYGSQHNVLNIFSKQTAAQNGLDWDDKWIADSQNQICWTAHGDESSYRRMIDFAVQRVISFMEKYPPISYPEITDIMFGIEDGGQGCRCAGCEYRYEMDGARSGAMLRFVRQVYDKIRLWVDDPANAEYYREKLQIVVFAYNDTKQAPAHKDAKGEWVVNEGLYEGMEEYRDSMFDNIVLWKSFVGPAHLDVTADVAEIQAQVEEFNSWDALFDTVYTWNYGELYLNKTYFLDFLTRWNKNLLDYYAGMGVDYMLTELCSNGDAVTRWGDLYYYMLVELSWDRTQSSTELISKFMKAEFGPAAETMEKLYYAQKMNFQRAADDYYQRIGSHYTIGKKSWTPEEYPYQTIATFINYINQAYEDIESLKITNPDLHFVIEDRIDVQGIAHYYELIQIHNGAKKPYTTEQKELYKSRALNLLSKDRRYLAALSIDTFLLW